ncbi:hypothetical protein CI109_103438 [Kwoniella shandongensis]|uniref:Uncharacterized protein n=1 Tax=Kwoniella shandongensis TaxID=1734106 RepID=A0A5M6C0V1_9TREE|nr:uncharacterized protein CI109_004518 [Kwoniella shandongensis]KAA5527225.1 hypothetical protein CI109_004518 [Kwoniella shandongensis]
MSAPTYEEMEAKRQEMITSFREIASAMTRCVQVIEDYTSLSPNHLTKTDFSQIAGGVQAALAPLNGHVIDGINVSSIAPGALDLKKERKKKEKKIRDPNAPKRPPSAYILFQNEIRDDIRNSNPGMAYKDILGIISQKWKDLTDSQKKVYEGLYQNAHKTYQAEEQAYSKRDDGIPVPAAIIPPVASESSDSSDSDDSSDDDSTPAVTVPTSVSKSKNIKPPTTTLPLQAPTASPATLQAATAAVAPASEKKEKKRKNKEDEAAVAAALGTAAEKKKKKKTKE